MRKNLALALRRMDERLVKQQRCKEHFAPPRKGWIRGIRDALGMSMRQLAERAKTSTPWISSIEKGEVEGSLTLNTLRKVANALDCDLVYALVPRKPLQVRVEERAREKATRLVKQTQQTMRLEEQGLSKKELEQQIKRLSDELLQGSARALWDD